MKFKHTKMIPGIMMIFAVLFFNCASVNRLEVDADSNRQMGFQIGDTFLSESVKIKDLVVEKNSAGNIITNILFKNMLYSELNIQVKVEFFDENGIIIDDPWGYKPLVIEGLQEKWIKFVSVSPKASTYAISFKSPD